MWTVPKKNTGYNAMPFPIWWGNNILFRDGAPAMSKDCCCPCQLIPCCGTCIIDADPIEDCHLKGVEDLVVSGPAEVTNLYWTVQRWVTESSAYEYMYTVEQDGPSTIQLQCVDLSSTGILGCEKPTTNGCYFKVPAKITGARNDAVLDLSHLIGTELDLSIWPIGVEDPGRPGDDDQTVWRSDTGVLGGIMYGGPTTQDKCDASLMEWVPGEIPLDGWENEPFNTAGTANVSGVRATPEGVSCKMIDLNGDGVLDGPILVWSDNSPVYKWQIGL